MRAILTSWLGGVLKEDGHEELFGEAYSILDGKISKICDNGGSLRLS